MAQHRTEHIVITVFGLAIAALGLIVAYLQLRRSRNHRVQSDLQADDVHEAFEMQYVSE